MHTHKHLLSRCAVGVIGIGLTLGVAAESRLDTATIEQLPDGKGESNEKEGVFTVRMPRTDLDVRAAGVHLTPPTPNTGREHGRIVRS